MARAPSKAAEAEHARNLRLLVATVAATFLLDQALKWLVVQRLGLIDRGVIEVAPPVFTLRMAWNQGVNFGIGAGLDARWLLVGVAVAISALVLVWVRRDRMGRLAHLSTGLLVGGAMGNVVDRVAYGAVADFLNFPFFGDLLAWAVEAATFGRLRPDAQYSLNLADIAIFLGATGLVLFAGAGAGRGDGARKAR